MCCRLAFSFPYRLPPDSLSVDRVPPTLRARRTALGVTCRRQAGCGSGWGRSLWSAAAERRRRGDAALARRRTGQRGQTCAGGGKPKRRRGPAGALPPHSKMPARLQSQGRSKMPARLQSQGRSPQGHSPANASCRSRTRPRARTRLVLRLPLLSDLPQGPLGCASAVERPVGQAGRTSHWIVAPVVRATGSQAQAR